ncbi:MAG: hypothetical protein KBD37_00155 [Burkholderiales bacterium]|nr:hypothetical protein [Burkholderiales bacterium]
MTLMIMCNLASAASQYPALESISGTPEEHVYKSIDFGRNSINGQRIQIKSAAPQGAPVYTSQLEIDNAGIQAGYIAPNSHEIKEGDSCSSDDLGKIVQHLAGGNLIISQLQCMYNPTFCSGAGYCFLPVKTTTFTYQFAPLKASAVCPAGTIVDSVHANNNIATGISCPIYSGLTLIQGVHGETANCYQNAVNLSFCMGYQSVCSYKDKNGVIQKVLVAALAQLTCTNSTATYTIDNYTQAD